MWIILTLVACVLLIAFWRGPNAVWGAITFGVLGGVIAATVYYFLGHGFQWTVVWKWVVTFVLVGGFFEIIPRILKRLK